MLAWYSAFDRSHGPILRVSPLPAYVDKALCQLTICFHYRLISILFLHIANEMCLVRLK